MTKYCKKCGWIYYDYGVPDFVKYKCDVCDAPLYIVPDTYFEGSRWGTGDGKQALIEEQVKTSLEFDSYLFEHREQILQTNQDKIDEAIRNEKIRLAQVQVSIPKCPTCQSTNIRRIDSAERGFSFALCGFFSNKINKSFECLNCGYTW